MGGISLYSARVEQFVSASLAESFAHSNLHADADEAIKLGSEAAAQLHLRESEAENHTTHYVTLRNGRGPDAFAEALGSFDGRIAGLRGWRRAQMTGEAHRSVTSQMIPNELVPGMKDRAKDLTAKALKQWESLKSPWSRQLGGLAKSRGYLNGILPEIRESARANSQKMDDLSQASASVAGEIEECQQRLDRFAQMAPVLRALFFPIVWSTSRRYRELARQAIRLELSLAACRVAQEDVFAPLQDYFLSELSYEQRLEGVLQEAELRAHTRATNVLAAPPSVLRTPTGLELADKPFLTAFWTAQTQQGGLERLTLQMLNTLLRNGGSLFGFLEGSANDVYAGLTSCARDLLRPSVDALDVMGEFRARYDNGRLAPVMERIVKDSLPRIRTRGEVGRHIPVVKLACVPAGSDMAWLREVLAQADRTEGSWEIVELPRPCDAIVFASYRSSLSLTGLIDLHEAPPEPPTARERIDGAADPLLALIPAGRMRASDARVAAAYAEAAGLLRHDAEDGHCLRQADGRERSLGRTAPEAIATLRSSFDDVVHIYSSWGERILDEGEAALGRLRELRSSSNQGGEGDGRALLNTAAIERAIDETGELLPFLENLRRRRAAQR